MTVKRPNLDPIMRRVLCVAAGFTILSSVGCASTKGSGATDPLPGADTFCRVAKPISWSSRDTDETIREVKAHNAVGKALCGWSA